jgi:hypothetical protein
MQPQKKIQPVRKLNLAAKTGREITAKNIRLRISEA